MRMLSPLRSYVCIASLFSSVSAISVTVGSPTQCDPLSISWTGGESPFTIQLTPFYQPLSTFSVPSSAFSNGQGSYSISPLPLASGTKFVLTVLDSTGYSPTAATTTVLTVGPPVANINCNTKGSQEFGFDTSGTLQQCSGYTFSTYGNPVIPLTIVGLIPGGNLVKMYPVTTSSYTWLANVQGGTEIAFFILDSDGNQGGVSHLNTTQSSSDTSCLNANSLSSTSISSTMSASSLPSISSQSQSGNTTSNIGIIAGAAGGGAVLLISLIALGMYCRRNASRSPDITSSPKREPLARQLQRKNEGREIIQDDKVMRNVAPQSTGHLSRSPETQPRSRPQSRLSDAPSIDPIRQHIRQISYMDSFPEDFAVNEPHTTLSRPSRLSADVDATAEHDDARSSSIPPASRRIIEMARQAASQDYPYNLRPVNHHTLPMQHGSISHHRSASNFTAGDHPSTFNSTQHSRTRSDTSGFARHASAGGLSVSSTGRVTTSNNTFPHQTIPVPFSIPIEHGTLSHHPSASGFTLSDGTSPSHHTQASHLSSGMDDFATHVNDGSSSTNRQMAAMAGRSASLGNPFPHQTAAYNPFTLSNQRGTISHHPSANSFAFSDGALPSHETQASRLSSNIDDFSRSMSAGSSSTLLPGGGQPLTASTPTTTHPSAQIVRHTDMADDNPAVTATQEVIELPPEYAERPFVAAEPAQGVVAEPPTPNPKSS